MSSFLGCIDDSLGPLSAQSGRKEFTTWSCDPDDSRADTVLSADTEAPPGDIRNVSRRVMMQMSLLARCNHGSLLTKHHHRRKTERRTRRNHTCQACDREKERRKCDERRRPQ